MNRHPAPPPAAPCPCGGKRFGACCAPLLAGTAAATDAERLMRSRYTAFSLGVTQYLLDTWHPATRPAELRLDVPAPRWIGLAVLAHARTGETTAQVEFVARYRVGGRACRLHETSRFERLDGRWYYIDGDIHDA